MFSIRGVLPNTRVSPTIGMEVTTTPIRVGMVW